MKFKIFYKKYNLFYKSIQRRTSFTFLLIIVKIMKECSKIKSCHRQKLIKRGVFDLENLYDLLIIGGGPAGLAAGIYGGRAKMDTLILEKLAPGGQALLTNELVNYPGFSQGTGTQIMEEWVNHAKNFGVTIKREAVRELELEGRIKSVTTKKGNRYQARSIILAPGSSPRKLHIRGEKEFTGVGVSYCAICDAAAFRNKEVLVIGSGDSAIEESLFLTRFVNKVTIVVIHDEGTVNANPISADKAFADPKIDWIWNSTLEEIKGGPTVNGAVIKNINTGELSEIKTDGVFIFIGNAPNTDFLKGKLVLDEQGYVIVGEDMSTSVCGVYAAGDARKKYLRQVITAANDGAIAAIAAEKYLAEEEAFREKVLEAASPVLLAFWSPLMPGNTDILTALEKAAKELEIEVVKIDASYSTNMAKIMHVEHLPQALLMNKGREIARIGKNFDRQNIKQVVKNALNQ